MAFLATDGCPDLVKAHVAFEADQTPFGSYDGGVGGATSPAPARAWGIADVPIAYTPPVTDPAQLVRASVGQNQFVDGLISNYSCILQANNATQKPRQLTNISKAPVLFLTSQASIHVTYGTWTSHLRLACCYVLPGTMMCPRVFAMKPYFIIGISTWYIVTDAEKI